MSRAILARILARSASLLALLAVAVLIPGCGGSTTLGTNADFSVRMSRTDGTQELRDYEIYLTRNGNTVLDLFDSEAYMSTQNQPTWADQYSSTRSSTQMRVDFRSRSDQPPYFLWVSVPNTTSQFETLELEIWVNGQQGTAKRFDLTIDATERIQAVRIDRDSATY